MTSSDTREIELAFSVCGGRSSLKHHPLLEAADTHTRQIVGTYFDTPDRVLHKAGWSLRIRQVEDRWFQTVKGPDTLAARPQLEVELNAANERRLDLDALKTTPVWPFIDGRSDALRPLFITDVRRTTRLLEQADASIEEALDLGEIRSLVNGDIEPLCDIELELKAGDMVGLFCCGVQLSLDAPVRLQPSSKAARGYRLVDGGAAQAVKQTDVTVDRHAETGVAVRAILTNVLQHLKDNLAPAYAGDPDGVHQTRVAMRRMRAALRLFRTVLPKEPMRSYQTQLKIFSQILGDARDWHVFVANILPAAATDMPDFHWLKLAEHAAIDKQAKADVAVREMLEGSAFNSLIVSIMGWAQGQPADRPWIGSRQMQRSLAETAPRMLRRQLERVATRRDHLDGSDETFHALRKAMKELRYSLEFIRHGYPDKPVHRYLDPCKEVQEVLGKFNDYSTVERLISLLVAESPAIAPASGELLTWAQIGKRRANRPLPKLLDRLNEAAPFWE